MTSSRSTGAPASSPARTAISASAAPGTTTWPSTRWSPSHGCAPAETRPDKTTPPSPGSSVTAPSSGWPAAPRPHAAASPPRAPDSQYRSRWNA